KHGGWRRRWAWPEHLGRLAPGNEPAAPEHGSESEDADQRPEEAGCGRTRRGPIEGLAIDFVGERQVLGDLPWRPFARRPWLTPPLGGYAAGRGEKRLDRLMMVAESCLEIGHDVLHSRRSAQILLYEAWAQVHVELDQRRIANAAEAVNL